MDLPAPANKELTLEQIACYKIITGIKQYHGADQINENSMRLSWSPSWGGLPSR